MASLDTVFYLAMWVMHPVAAAGLVVQVDFVYPPVCLGMIVGDGVVAHLGVSDADKRGEPKPSDIKSDIASELILNFEHKSEYKLVW